MFKRIFLFLAVNVLVVLTISIVLNILGIRPYLEASGINYQSLAGFCLVWGMGGSFISLLLSKVIAKWSMGVQIIDPMTRDENLQELVQMVYRLSKAAGLSKMPEVGIYDSPDVNAFATGPTRSNALVAVSTGLMGRMNHREIEGVLGHEIAHVANGDMVTMTLIQGIVNAFVMFLSRAIAFAIANMGRRDDDDRAGFSRGTYFIVQFVLEIVFMILGTMVVAWFSRYREFRADAGGARIAGRDNMIGALRALQRVYGSLEGEPGSNASPTVQTLQISGKTRSWLQLFATHPPLEQRIEALELATGL